MGKVVTVTSGKGGVGKSSICCHLGRALAQKGKSTVILELDCGLRGLDIMLGVSQSVYDLGDIIHNRCNIRDAITSVPGCRGLSLLCAPAQFERFPTKDEIQTICLALKKIYDYVLVDTSAGYGLMDVIPSVSDLILLTVTPDPICIRDGGLVAALLREKQASQIRLIINRVSKQTLKRKMVSDLDAVIDGVGVQLIGVIPEQREFWTCTAKGEPLSPSGLSGRVFNAIASRVDEAHTPLVLQ